MGNSNCCKEIKEIQKEFDVENIFLELKKRENEKKICAEIKKKERIVEKIDSEIKKQEIITEEIVSEIKKQQSEEFHNLSISNKIQGVEIRKPCSCNHLIIRNYDLLSNSNSKDYSIENYVSKEDQPLNWIKYVNLSFREEENKFSKIFIEKLNEARTDILGLSKILIQHYNNFNFIQNKIFEIKDENLKKELLTKKENFKEASNFYNELH